jgi:hypothetical protein
MTIDFLPGWYKDESLDSFLPGRGGTYLLNGYHQQKRNFCPLGRPASTHKCNVHSQRHTRLTDAGLFFSYNVKAHGLAVYHQTRREAINVDFRLDSVNNKLERVAKLKVVL